MIKRSFFIGDEWLYYKIYCGPKTVDSILSEVILPLTESWKANTIIDKWFFIRYNDPENHLRVRFHLVKEENIIAVTSNLNTSLKPFIDSNLVWKVMTDTYQREIERYGSNTVVLAEDLFSNDSKLTAGIVSMIEGDEGEIIRWGVGLRSVDAFIDDFDYNLDEKFELLAFMKDSFAREFHMNKSLRKQLGSKYRKESVFIENIMNQSNDAKSEFLPIYMLIKERSENNRPIIEKIIELKNNGTLEKPLNDFMWSFLHMLNNRLFKSKQRIHELVIYDFLYQYYKSKLARMGKKFR